MKLTEEKRLYRRKQTKDGNKILYNGETANDISKRRDLRHKEDILDKY